MRRIAGLAIALAVLGTSASAQADNDIMNLLVGPVLGIRLSGPDGEHGVIGLEGGVGWGAERINLGVEHRADRWLYYVELDPWLLVGASFGFGVDSAGEGQGIVGLWEGIPVGGDFLHHHVGCPGLLSAFTVAAGLRYTGVLELYVTVKAGVSEEILGGTVCD
jgi:hypothetical protein